MKRLTRNLINNSIDAFILALETINRPSVSYRMEAFCFLHCNAWELLVKAKLLHEGQKIFYRKRPKHPRRSLSLNDCLGHIFTDADSPTRLNIEKITELRNTATHLVVPFVPPDIMGLFQAGVLNYSCTLGDWFGISLSDRVPLGMMSLVYDFDPEKHSLEGAKLHRKLPAETIQWLGEFQQSVRERAKGLGASSTGFFIPIELKLALVRNPRKADVNISAGAYGREALLVEVPKEPDKTHPHRMKDVIGLVNLALAGSTNINSFDIVCIRAEHNIQSRADFYYKSKFASPQYSQTFVDWLIKRYQNNSNFFAQARANWKQR